MATTDERKAGSMDDRERDQLPGEEQREVIQAWPKYRGDESAMLRELKEAMTRALSKVRDRGGTWTGEACVILVCHDGDGNICLSWLNSGSERDILVTNKAISAYRISIEGEPRHIGQYL